MNRHVWCPQQRMFWAVVCRAPSKVVPPWEVAAWSRLATFLFRTPRLAQTAPPSPEVTEQRPLPCHLHPPGPASSFCPAVSRVSQVCSPRAPLIPLSCRFPPPCCLLGAISQPGGAHCVPHSVCLDFGAFGPGDLCSPFSLPAAPFPPVPFLLRTRCLFVVLCFLLKKSHEYCSRRGFL